MIRRLLSALLPAALLFLAAACAPEEERLSLEVPPTPVLTSDSAWGVVNVPYQKVHDRRDAASGVDGLLREGDLVEVVSKVGAEDGRSYWLEVAFSEGRGWIPDAALDVYDSRAQAETAAAGMAD